MLESAPLPQKKIDKEGTLFVPFSPENEKLKEKFMQFFRSLEMDKKRQVLYAITAYTERMKEKYGQKDVYKYEALQIIGFSGQRASVDGQAMIADDFPGEDSVKHFVDTLMANYGPELKEKV